MAILVRNTLHRSSYHPVPAVISERRSWCVIPCAALHTTLYHHGPSVHHVPPCTFLLLTVPPYPNPMSYQNRGPVQQVLREAEEAVAAAVCCSFPFRFPLLLTLLEPHPSCQCPPSACTPPLSLSLARSLALLLMCALSLSRSRPLPLSRSLALSLSRSRSLSLSPCCCFYFCTCFIALGLEHKCRSDLEHTC
jgi:hypothetical protein